MFKSLVSIAIALGLSSAAFADGGQAQQNPAQQNPAQQSGKAGLEIIKAEWDQFQRSCDDPEGELGRQNAPEQITVTCDEIRTVWKESDSDNMELENEKYVRGSLTSSKATVGSNWREFPLESGDRECTVFTKYQVVASHTIKDVKCEATKGYDSIQEFCLAQTASKLAAKDISFELGKVVDSPVSNCDVDQRAQQDQSQGKDQRAQQDQSQR